MKWITHCLLFCLPLFLACKQEKKLFEKVDDADTGIHFTNTITEDSLHNVFTYQYYYNGNGVAAGDINNDGLADLFFTGNQTPSALYLNKGNLKFEDITKQAGVVGKNAWRTGATMADVNGDGLLDIFVCYSGFGTDQDRAKQLFINQGNDKNGVPSFKESAAAYGLDAPGTYTSQAAFFDFDKDGDLDAFLLNHADGFYSPFFNTTHLRNLRHPKFGNRLYRNDNGHFTDISSQAGIFGSGINFGLGISISDINNDGWPDIFVSNDFHEQDFLYLNNGDGTFKEVCQQVFGHMSRNTMGVDIADYNNDGLYDVVALDMLPESNYRQKILQGADEYDKYNLMVDSGYGHQNNRNMLQLHRGFTKEGLPVFSEIGQLAGVSNTDWSWASLFADFDNDGWKDLFVTNGYLRESTNLDFIKYNVAKALDEANQKGLDVSTREAYEKNMPLYELVRKMPSTKLSNYIFRNKRDLTFSNESTAWGVDEPGVSSGAAYADLDNDGDLDLVVCNNNDPVWVYRNNANELEKNNYLRIRVVGDGMNTYAIGAKVQVITDTGMQVQEIYPVRGYQSSVDYVLNFGLGKSTKVNKVIVVFSTDTAVVVSSPRINQLLTIRKKDAVFYSPQTENQTPLFDDITSVSGIDFIHHENMFVDFKREFLMPYELSRQGPKMSKGDVNGDGLEDIFIGGAAEQPAALYLQKADKKFQRGPANPWQEDAIFEDIGSTFFDADNDHDLDLYVVSGGNEWSAGALGLQDRLYLNDGKGNFTRAVDALPAEYGSGSCVTAADYDKDGDMDLFIGGRTDPGNYPFSTGHLLLRNDFDKSTGKVHFTKAGANVAGEMLSVLGMVTDAVWTDVDKDSWPDLVVTGDWMPVKIFHNEKGQSFKDISEASGLAFSDGWWCKIVAADVDEDGDTDFILGNLGLNTQFRTNEKQPLITYAGDFNNDGKTDPVMTWYVQGKSYPFNTRDELVEQMPSLNKKFIRYEDYANAGIEDIFSKQQLTDAKKIFIYHTESSLLINNNGKFELKPLPILAQFSIVNSILYGDYDADGKKDLLLAGNFFPFRVQQGKCDAGIGLFMKGDGKGNFHPLPYKETALYIPGDVRDMIQVNKQVIISKNNAAIQELGLLK